MITNSVSRRYARALFELLDAKEVEPMRAGLRNLGQCLTESSSLRHLVASPAFTTETKMEVLVALSERVKCPAVVKGFLGQLVAKNRVDQIPGIAEAFGVIADQAKGITPVTVTSATGLGKKERESVDRQLGAVAGGQFAVTYEKDPKLLAGIRIRIGSKVYDTTLRNRLDTMRGVLAKE